MKILRASTLSIALVSVAACGGASDEDGRDNDRVGNGGSGDAGADEGNGDGDEGGGDEGGEVDGDDDDQGGSSDPGSASAGAEGSMSSAGAGQTPSAGAGIEGTPSDAVSAMTPVAVDPATGSLVGVSMSAPPGVVIGRPVPAPGTPSGDPPPPPENCVPSYQSESVDYCELQQSCDNDYVYSYCYVDGAGGWYCDCGTNYTYGSYQLTGVDGTSACTVASELCSQGTLPEFSGEPVCQPSYQSINAGYCEKQVACTQSAEVADGVTAVRSDYQYGFCQDLGDGTLSCQCNTSVTYQNYALSGSTLSEGCDVVLDLCNSGEVPEFTGPEECTPSYQYDDAQFCELQVACTQSTEVADGVVAELSEYEYANCQTNAGVASCNCSNNSRYLRFQMEAAQSGTCDAALGICSSDAELAPEGPVSCSRTSQYAGTGYCETSFDCTQDASIDGVTVGVYGNIYAYCQPSDAGWTCTCSSGNESAQVDVDAADEWAACTDVGALCQDAIEVQIGSTGGYYGGGGIGVPDMAPRPVPLK